MEWGFYDWSIRLFLGVFIGFCIGLTGIGGGVLGLQATTLVLGMDPVAAVGTTSLYIFLTNISASVHHARLGNIEWGAATRILAGAVPVNILVGRWVAGKGDCAGFQHSLKGFIICVVIFCIVIMLINTFNGLRQKVETSERGFAERLKGRGMLRNTLCVLLGGGIGGLIGASSVGGGVLIVPMLIIVFGLSASRTVGSSIFIAMILTFVTALLYNNGGQVEIKTAVTMASGSLLGVYYGSKLASKLPDSLLKGIVILLISAAAAMMLCSYLG